ncbi:MAG: hypothetical protein GXP59_06225 [Deltaproteobacteria bacterium]|nr:hypothetical protein [Deltaproteobacteria bacterium]
MDNTKCASESCAADLRIRQYLLPYFRPAKKDKTAMSYHIPAGKRC